MTRSTGSGPQAVRGVSERLPPADEPRAERFLDDLAALGTVPVRLVLMRQDWDAPGASSWYRWLLPRIAEGRCASVALRRRGAWTAETIAPASAGDAGDYRKFVAEVHQQLGDACDWLELADPLGPAVWPDLSAPSQALLGDVARDVAGRICLGGIPLDAGWLRCAVTAELPAGIQALAFSHLPPVDDWAGRLRQSIDVLRDRAALQLWITADLPGSLPAGQNRLPEVLAACSAGSADAADRVYLGRCPGESAGVSDRDERSLRSADDKPSLLARWLGAGELEALPPRFEAPRLRSPRPDAELIIGGAGFVGCNVAARLARTGRRVLIFDDLSRPGTELNAAWLLRSFPDQVRLLTADIRDFDAVRHAVARAARIFHFAAQVAVTTSLDHPHHDHEINTLGTLNVLEAARRRRERPALLFTSTNKVYGALPDIPLARTKRGYEPEDASLRECGIDERRPLAFCSPYGCSKGAADQYVLDYAHTFGVPAAVLRMSCIYGPRQFGNEDQGWIAHFVRRVLAGEPITLYGDGFQVRDVLYVDDLVDAALAVSERASAFAGEVFNVGGGPAHILSLQGLLERLSMLHGALPPIHAESWRPGDQRYYVSDTTKLRQATGWAPRVGVEEGVGRLYAYLRNDLGNTAVHSRSDTGRVAL